MACACFIEHDIVYMFVEWVILSSKTSCVVVHTVM